MREMVLNHASVWSPNKSLVLEWLNDLAAGMGRLCSEMIAGPSMRSVRHPQEILCFPSMSLHDAIVKLKDTGARDQSLFLLRLSSKSPLLKDIGQEVENHILGCEHASLPPEKGDPLVYCAITNGIAVGFPSKPYWDRDQLSVDFREIAEDGSFEESSEEIDNLSRSAHAHLIATRHQIYFRNQQLLSADSLQLWEKRQELFPNLVFGPRLETDLKRLNRDKINHVKTQLAKLDVSVAEWKEINGPVPAWRTKVTDESSPVKNNPKLRNARLFLTEDGNRQHFFWHARFANAGRIHLRFEKKKSLYKVEIGYIGPHLPLK